MFQRPTSSQSNHGETTPLVMRETCDTPRNEEIQRIIQRVEANQSIPEGSLTWRRLLIRLKKKLAEFINTTIVGKTFEDDSATSAVKELAVMVFITLLLWTISYILVMEQIIRHGRFSHEQWVLFLPMWFGSVTLLMGIYMIVKKMTTKIALVSRQRRLYLTSLQSNDNLNGEVHPRNIAYIDFDSLPLFRRVTCWLVLLFVSSLLVLTTQILYYLWFIHKILKVWHAIIPTAVILLIMAIYMYLVEVFSLISCAIYSLLVYNLILFTMQVDGANISQTSMLAPILFCDISGITYYTWILNKYFFQKQLALSKTQLCATIGYLLSMILIFLVLTCKFLMENFPNYYNENSNLLKIYRNDYFDFSNARFVYIIWMIAIPLVVLSVGMVTVHESRILARDKCYIKPKPVYQDDQGVWRVADCNGETVLCLLGTVTLLKETQTPFIATTHRENINSYGTI